MKLFAWFRKTRALRRYARELPRQLHSDYGASEYFSPAQIKVAAGKLKLDNAFIGYAYAGLLSEEAFTQLSPRMPDLPSYEDLRAEFLRYVPSRSFSSGSVHESGLGLLAGSSEGDNLGNY